MTRRRLVLIAVPLLLMLLLVGTCVTLAQRPRFGGGGMQDFGGDERRGVPDWKLDPRFKSDVFTFVRVEYDSSGGGRGGFGGGRRGGGRGGFGGLWVAAMGAAAGRPTFPTAT